MISATADSLLTHKNFQVKMNELEKTFGNIEFPTNPSPMNYVPIGLLVYLFLKKINLPYRNNRAFCQINEITANRIAKHFNPWVLKSFNFTKEDDNTYECMDGNTRIKGTSIGYLDEIITNDYMCWPVNVIILPHEEKLRAYIDGNVQTNHSIIVRLSDKSLPMGFILNAIGCDLLPSKNQKVGAAVILLAYNDYFNSSVSKRDEWFTYGSVYSKYRAILKKYAHLVHDKLPVIIDPKVARDTQQIIFRVTNILKSIQSHCDLMKKENNDITNFKTVLTSSAIVPFLMISLLGDQSILSNKPDHWIAKTIIKKIVTFAELIPELAHGKVIKQNKISEKLLKLF